ncbi:MAG: hypothetical protein AAF497_11300, partial [Planctomycetota bacterium]
MKCQSVQRVVNLRRLAAVHSTLVIFAAIILLAGELRAQPAPVVTPSTTPATGNQPAPIVDAAPERCLLMKNGSLIRGQIEAAAETFTVQFAKGGKMRVARNQVRFLADSPQSAYRYLASQVAPLDSRGRVKLTEWCLEHRLLPEAATEINTLSTRKSMARDVERLQNRLAMLRTLDKPRPNVGTGKVVSKMPKPAAAPKVSAEALSEFTKKVQPLLVNSCAAASCHGRTSVASFRLTQPPKGMGRSRRMSQQNLIAVLQQVDYASPAKSPLLTTLEQTHAGIAPQSLVSGDHLKSITRWVEMVTGATLLEPEQPAKLAEPS